MGYLQVVAPANWWEAAAIKSQSVRTYIASHYSPYDWKCYLRYTTGGGVGASLLSAAIILRRLWAEAVRFVDLMFSGVQGRQMNLNKYQVS